MISIAALVWLSSAAAAFAAEPPRTDAGKAAAPTAGAAKSDADKAPAAKSENATADENRKKPLQRCDQLADKAQLDCLNKARENIVEARRKRETVGAKAEATKGPAPAEGEKKTK